MYFISARPNDSPGVEKTEETTQTSGNRWEKILNEGAAAFHEDFVVYRHSQEEEIAMNNSCFNSFRSEPHVIMTTKRIQWHLTAKTNARSDDAFIAMLSSVYWKTEFWSNTARYHKQINEITMFNQGARVY